MANLSSVPNTVWLVGAGGLALVGGGYIPDSRTRLLVRVGGGIMIAAAFFMGVDDILDFLGVKKKPTVVSNTTSPIVDIHTGSPASTGIVAAKILSPTEGEKLSSHSGTYPVAIALDNSTDSDLAVTITLRSSEFYSFGSQGNRVTDLGSILLQSGEERRMEVNVQTANESFFTNPFYPPEVSLELLIDGVVRDNIRFQYE